MPTTASIPGVFDRQKRQTQTGTDIRILPAGEESRFEGTSSRSATSSPQPPLRKSPPTLKAGRLLQKQQHRRDSSSLLSLSSISVTDFRRSTSLRTHRRQLSGGAGNHSVGDLLLVQQHDLSPTLDPPGSTSPPSPARHRSKLSFSTRPFSRSLKSTETLPLFTHDANPVPDVPPIMANDHNRKPLSMLQSAPYNRQQGFASQVSLVRDIPPSSHGSESVGPPPTSSGGQTPHAIFQQIQETAAKRMATIQYMRRLHEGDIFFFNTLHFSQTGLHSLPSLNPAKLGRRAMSYFALGYSMPILLDVSTGSALEYLKLLTNLLQEFETYQAFDGSGSLSRGRMGAMFKNSMGLGKGPGKGRRQSGTTETYTDPVTLGLPQQSQNGGISDALPAGYEFTYLITPHMPFDPDFSTAFSSLCDTLMDMYANLLNTIGGPDGCSLAIAEAFSKADKLIRKILVSNVVKEFEEHSRGGAKQEIAGVSRLVLGGLM